MKKLTDRFNKGQSEWSILAIYPPPDRGILCILDISLDESYDIPYYDFIFNPKYKCIETLMKDEEFVEEFWEWMASKNYTYIASDLEIYLEGMDKLFLMENKPQMLTGYIKEFIESEVL